MGTKHLTETDRLRARTLFFDAGLPKSRICQLMGFSLNQVKLAIREKTPKPRTGRPRRKPREGEAGAVGAVSAVSVVGAAGAAGPATGSPADGGPAMPAAAGNGMSTVLQLAAPPPPPPPPVLDGRIHKPPPYREWPLMGTPARLSSMSSGSRAVMTLPTTMLTALPTMPSAGLLEGRASGLMGFTGRGRPLLPATALHAPLAMAPVSTASRMDSTTAATTATTTPTSVPVPSLIIPPIRY